MYVQCINYTDDRVFFLKHPALATLPISLKTIKYVGPICDCQQQFTRGTIDLYIPVKLESAVQNSTYLILYVDHLHINVNKFLWCIEQFNTGNGFKQLAVTQSILV